MFDENLSSIEQRIWNYNVWEPTYPQDFPNTPLVVSRPLRGDLFAVLKIPFGLPELSTLAITLLQSELQQYYYLCQEHRQFVS